MSTRKAASPGGQSPAALPPLTVARFEQATLLMERLVDENTDVFVGRMHAYRERQRAATSRKLTPDEAASVAAGLAASLSDDADLVGVAEDVQAGGLRAVDEPGAHEVLLAAGVAPTARGEDLTVEDYQRIAQHAAASEVLTDDVAPTQ